MVTQRQIQKWKAKYEEVYMVPIQEQAFYFRILGREEYRIILDEELPVGEFQEAVCRTAVLHPADYDFSSGGAGYAEVLCDFILQASGLMAGQAQELLNEYREEMLVFDNQVDCLIHEAFPEYKIENIKHWSVKKTMWHVARAEFIMRNLRGINLVPVDQQAQMMMEQMEGQPEPQTTPKQPPKAPQMTPQEWAESSPLATYQEPPKRQQRPSQPVPQQQPVGDEAAMLAMLQQAMASHPTSKGSRQIAPPTTSIDSMPELSWFRAEEELKGEFD